MLIRLLQWPIRAQENSKAKGEEPMRVKKKKKHGNDVKCGKTMVTKIRSDLDPYLIG